MRLIALLLIFLAGTANAAIVTMDFEGIAGDNAAVFNVVPYSESNMTIGSDITQYTGIFGKNYSGAVNNTNGSAVFGWCNQSIAICEDIEHEFTLTNDLGVFDLLSLDAAWGREYSGESDLRVTGFYDGGGSITQVLDLSLVYSTYSFDVAWTGLSSVRFNGTCGGGCNTFPNYYQCNGLCDAIAIDNVVVNAVPVPAAVWLFGSALAALGWLRRSRTL